MTGVDISMQRLASCRTMINKYKCPNVILVLGDGTTFDVPPPTFESDVGDPDCKVTHSKKRSKRRKHRHEAVRHCECQDVQRNLHDHGLTLKATKTTRDDSEDEEIGFSSELAQSLEPSEPVPMKETIGVEVSGASLPNTEPVLGSSCTHQIFHRSRGFNVQATSVLRLYDKVTLKYRR